MRRAWHCDCDGDSHRAPVRRVALAGLGATVGRIVAGMERTTGYAPTSCPWRAYGDPVVSAAMTLRGRCEQGTVMIDDQLAVVVEALEACESARATVEAIDRRAERAKRDAERRAREVKNGG